MEFLGAIFGLTFTIMIELAILVGYPESNRNPLIFKLIHYRH